MNQWKNVDCTVTQCQLQCDARIFWLFSAFLSLSVYVCVYAACWERAVCSLIGIANLFWLDSPSQLSKCVGGEVVVVAGLFGCVRLQTTNSVRLVPIFTFVDNGLGWWGRCFASVPMQWTSFYYYACEVGRRVSNLITNFGVVYFGECMQKREKNSDFVNMLLLLMLVMLSFYYYCLNYSMYYFQYVMTMSSRRLLFAFYYYGSWLHRLVRIKYTLFLRFKFRERDFLAQLKRI